MPTDKEKLLEKLLEKNHYKENYKPPVNQIVFRIEGKNIGSLGNFIVFSGLPKAGKSQFLQAFISSAISGLNVLDLEVNRVKNTIALFDTESNEYDFYTNLENIKNLSGTKLPDFFHAFKMREETPSTNREAITYYIERFKSKIIIIDGFLDLIDNFNDEREARLIINWLKFVTSKFKILIVGVIHLGKKDNHTLGHFGSMIDRYAQSVLEVVKEKETGTFELKAKMLRSASDFTPIRAIRQGEKIYKI
jgi:hypothetical protein